MSQLPRVPLMSSTLFLCLSRELVWWRMHRWTRHYWTIKLLRLLISCSEPPQNVALTATGPDTLQFSWSPPPQFQATLYVVIFQRATYQFNPSSDLVMDLDWLNTYTRYTCCVAANTASGASRIACATQTTLETGNLTACQKLMDVLFQALTISSWNL